MGGEPPLVGAEPSVWPPGSAMAPVRGPSGRWGLGGGSGAGTWAPLAKVNLNTFTSGSPATWPSQEEDPPRQPALLFRTGLHGTIKAQDTTARAHSAAGAARFLSSASAPRAAESFVWAQASPPEFTANIFSQHLSH